MSLLGVRTRPVVVLSLGLCGSLLFGQCKSMGMDDEVLASGLDPGMPDRRPVPQLLFTASAEPPTDISLAPQRVDAQAVDAEVEKQWVRVPGQKISKALSGDVEIRNDKVLHISMASRKKPPVELAEEKVEQVSLATPDMTANGKEGSSAESLNEEISMWGNEGPEGVTRPEVPEKLPAKAGLKKAEEKPTVASALPAKDSATDSNRHQLAVDGDSVGDLPVRKRADAMVLMPTPVKQPSVERVEPEGPEVAEKPEVKPELVVDEPRVELPKVERVEPEVPEVAEKLKTKPSQVPEDPRERPPNVETTLPPVVPKMVRQPVQRLDHREILPKPDVELDSDSTLSKTDVSRETLVDELKSVVGMERVGNVERPAVESQGHTEPVIGETPTSTAEATRKLNAQLPAPAPQRSEGAGGAPTEFLFDDMEAPAPLK